ncbi:MAG: N-acetylmuramoyl-L-alanine amidase [Acidimicrobiia bacterium]
MSSYLKGRPWLAGALATLTLVSCSLGTTTTPISRDFSVVGPTPSSTLPETTTTTEAPAPDAPTNSPPEPAGVLITPSGVVVALLDQNGDHFVIRTPCGVETTIEGGTPVGDIEVVIDPGHGGAADPGAVGPNGLTEEEINLRVSRAVQEALSERGVKSLLTRTADYSSLLGVRAALADQASASLLVSIHHNAPTANLGDEPGTEVFVQSTSTDSRRLGGLVYEYVFVALQQFDVVWSRAPDAGVLEVLLPGGNDAYGMIRNPETVAVLVELGYLSNRQEAELFTTPEYVTVVAQAVSDAVISYLETDAPGSGFIAAPRVFTPNRGIGANACEDPALS